MKILVYDYGLCTSHAQKLAEQGHMVFYYVPWQDTFPQSTKALIGEGLEGLHRITDFWDYVDKVDIIVFFDNCCGDLVDYLRKKGYKVFGAGKAEQLELNRIKQKEILKTVGLPVGEYEVIHGLSALREYLKENKDKYVKINAFRGDVETFHHKDYKSSLPLLDHIAYKLGAKQEELDFIVEDTIPGVEPGYDGFVVDGKYPEITMYGYELKGAGYIGRVVLDKGLPPALKEINTKLAPFFKVCKARTMFSTEVRVGEDRKGYLIDPCVSEDTEILTNKGWKFFKDLNGSELVVTLNPETREIEYQKPTAYQKYWYEGEMIRIVNSSIDVLITPEHKFWITTPKNKKLHPVEARNLPKTFSIPRTGKWKGIELEYFVLPEYKNKWHSGKGKGIDKEKYCPPLIIKMEDWLRFLGIYLAEGNCDKWVVNIAQTTKKEEIKEIIKKLPFNFSEDKNGFRIFSVQLVNYLKQFGYANEKFVPNFVKDLSPRLINIFLDAFCLGDGSIRKNGARRFYTTSQKLRDDIQELLLKAGSVGNYYLKQKKETELIVKRKKYVRKFDGYIICERKKYQNFLKEWNDNCIKREFYQGFVYDITVPNHIIYIRRNGKPLWTSNCVRAPMPVPSAIEIEIYKNFSDIIINAAQGKLIKPQPIAKYGVGVCLESEWAQDHWLEITIPEEIKQWVKLRMAVKFGNKYYAVPGFTSICSVIGLGNTIDEAAEKCKKRVEMVDAYMLDKDTSGIEKIKEIIEEGKHYGIPF